MFPLPAAPAPPTRRLDPTVYRPATAQHLAGLSRVRGTAGSRFRVRHVSPLWLGKMRVISGASARQLDLLPEAPSPELRLLDERERGTRFVRLSVRSVLNSPATTGMGFWSVNPYVGCEFGCTYCYARDTHRYTIERTGQQRRGPAWLDFEKRILVKTEVAEVLARTLDPARIGQASLVIGTATDPYQPAERRFRLTRAVLEVLLQHRGLSIGIITKSPLVTRDLAILQALSQRHELSVNISLATMDARVARKLELRSPVPSARIRALRRLTAGGIHAGPAWSRRSFPASPTIAPV